jgi:hypothetical protein
MNVVELKRRTMLDQKFRHCSVLYQSDKGKTTDVHQASLDSYGQPIVTGFSNEEFVPHIDYRKRQTLSFNPANPTAREAAFLARDSMLTLTSTPNDYTDKFVALQRVNNSANALASGLQSLKNKPITTPNTNPDEN